MQEHFQIMEMIIRTTATIFSNLHLKSQMVFSLPVTKFRPEQYTHWKRYAMFTFAYLHSSYLYILQHLFDTTCYILEL